MKILSADENNFPIFSFFGQREHSPENKIKLEFFGGKTGADGTGL